MNQLKEKNTRTMEIQNRWVRENYYLKSEFCEMKLNNKPKSKT